MVAFTHVGNANANAASVTTALSANVPSGALIVVHTHETHIGTGAVTDTKGNTYHLAGVGTYVTGNVAIWYAFNATALTSGVDTVTYTPGTSDTCALDVNYATGMKTTSAVLDNVNTRSNQIGLPSITLTPVDAGCLLSAIAATNDSGSPVNTGAWSAPPNQMFSAFDISGSLVDPGATLETFAPTAGGSTSGAAVIASWATAGANPPESGTVTMAFNGIAMNVQTTDADEGGAVAMAFNGIGLKVNTVDVSAEPTLINFFVF